MNSIAEHGESFWQLVIYWFTLELFKIGETPLTMLSIIRVLVILVVAIWISRIIRHGIDQIAGRNASFKQETAYTLSRLVHYVILALGILVGLSSIGVQLTSLAIVAGALGVGIGFGLQSIFNNFVSGLIMLFERNVKVGDYVVLQSGIEGRVREISVRSTLITTNDNLDIIVPNSEFITAQVTNWTMNDRLIRVHVPFGVAYGSDKDQVKRAALEAAEKVPFTYNDEERREPLVWLVGFGNSSLDFELVVWVDTKGITRPGATRAAYLWELETALRKYRIEIPFPQRDLHLRSGFLHTSQGSEFQEPANKA